MKPILRTAAATLLCLPFRVSADCPDAEQAALEKFDRDWGDAVEAGDRAKLEAMLADDFRDLSPDGGTSHWTKVDGRWLVWASQGTQIVE